MEFSGRRPCIVSGTRRATSVVREASKEDLVTRFCRVGSSSQRRWKSRFTSMAEADGAKSAVFYETKCLPQLCRRNRKKASLVFHSQTRAEMLH
jgi:hypothetical protein